jgi:hypothetical protein
MSDLSLPKKDRTTLSGAGGDGCLGSCGGTSSFKSSRCEYGATICPALALASLFACIGIPLIFLEEQRQRVAYFIASSVVCLLLAIVSHQVNIVRPITRLEESSTECIKILMQYCNAARPHLDVAGMNPKGAQISSAFSGRALTISEPASPADVRFHPQSGTVCALDMEAVAREETFDMHNVNASTTTNRATISSAIAEIPLGTSTIIMAARRVTLPTAEPSEELVAAQNALLRLAEHVHVSSPSGLYYVLQGQCKDILLALITTLRVLHGDHRNDANRSKQ